MSAKHALLGLLRQKPAYRYQLGDRLEKALGPAWKINPGQLYQTVRLMEEAGLIERVDGAPEDEDEKHIFAITYDGTEESERWFEKDASKIRMLRQPLLVKIMLAGHERLESAKKQIKAFEQECIARVKELTRKRDEVPVGGLRVRADHELLRCALVCELAYVDAELKNARYMEEVVIRLKHQDVVWPGTHGRPPTKKTRDRRSARDELFGRIAERRLQAERGKPEQDGDG